MAAGQSKRMGCSKLSIELEPNRRLGGIALERALQSSLDHIVIVTRREEGVEWLPTTLKKVEGRRLRSIHCLDADKGMAHSLRSGLQKACEQEVPEAVVVMLADQPFITASMIDGLIQSFMKRPQLDYCAVGCMGAPRPPVLIARSMFEAVGQLEGDEGARALFFLPHYSGMVIEEDEHYRFLDADTPEELERVRFYYLKG